MCRLYIYEPKGTGTSELISLVIRCSRDHSCSFSKINNRKKSNCRRNSTANRKKSTCTAANRKKSTCSSVNRKKSTSNLEDHIQSIRSGHRKKSSIIPLTKEPITTSVNSDSSSTKTKNPSKSIPPRTNSVISTNNSIIKTRKISVFDHPNSKITTRQA